MSLLGRCVFFPDDILCQLLVHWTPNPTVKLRQLHQWVSQVRTPNLHIPKPFEMFPLPSCVITLPETMHHVAIPELVCHEAGEQCVGGYIFRRVRKKHLRSLPYGQSGVLVAYETTMRCFCTCGKKVEEAEHHVSVRNHTIVRQSSVLQTRCERLDFWA